MVRWSPIAILLIAAVATPGFAQETYSSRPGKYSIKFGGQTKEVDQDIPLPDGSKTKLYSTLYEASANKAFLATYCDYPDSINTAPASKVLEGVRDGSAKDGKIVEDNEITYGEEKLPGREYIIQKGMFYMRFRAYLRGTRLYQVGIVATAMEDVKSQEAEDFFKSFALMR